MNESNPSKSEDVFGPVIYAYTRAQAIEDGVLVDVSKMAKEAGIKFTFGTNNTGRELGRLEYCLRMIEECGLTPDDIFIPEPHEKKPVLVKGLPKKITG